MLYSKIEYAKMEYAFRHYPIKLEYSSGVGVIKHLVHTVCDPSEIRGFWGFRRGRLPRMPLWGRLRSLSLS